MSETQKTITAWADETFGPGIDLARLAARANEEMAELLTEVTSNSDLEICAVEAADVLIVLYIFAEKIGFDLDAMVDHKMQINRSREWVRDGTGAGYHVRTKPREAGR